MYKRGLSSNPRRQRRHHITYDFAAAHATKKQPPLGNQASLAQRKQVKDFI